MTALEEMQFELLPNMSASDGQVFGIGADVSVDDGGFLPGEDDWGSESVGNPRRGGVTFGREVLNGPVWGFNLHVDQEDVASAKAALGAFKSAWRALSIRTTPGKVLPLRYRLGDEVRRVYGRPGRFAAAPTNLMLGGYVPITCDFQCVDNFTYDDVQNTIVLGLVQGSSGGFVFPTTFPTTTLPTGTTAQQAVVGGDAPTYPIIRFNGPVTKPSLATGDWVLTIDRTIAAGEYVEVDLRPWALSVLLNGVSSVAGSIGRRTYLADMRLEPGNREMIYRGSSNSPSSTCEVRWSNAHNSI